MLRRFLLVALAVPALLLTGCSNLDEAGSSSASGKSVNFMTVYAANSPDPHVCRTAYIMNSGSVETLVAVDSRAQTLQPGLATAWKTSDGKTWTFTIRDGVTFHNGKPVTAEAVQASLQAAMEKNPGVKVALDVSSMTASGQTLTIITNDVRASLPSELAHYNTVITDVTATGDLPVGTGPFKFVSFDIGGEAKLDRFDDYWGGKAKIDHVTMSANDDANARMLALRSGAADIIHQPSIESLAAIRQDSSLTVDTTPGTRIYHLLFNYAGPHADLWNDVEFRKGITALTDREAITQTTLHGEAVAVDSPFAPQSALAPAEAKTAVGKEIALEHFAKAGLDVKDGKVTQAGAPLQLRLGTYIARPELPQIAQVFQAAAAQVGIQTSIETADNIDEYLAKGEWDLATYSMATVTRGDASYFFKGGLMPGGAQNSGKLDDPQLNEQLKTYEGTLDVAKRVEMTKGVAAHLREHAYNVYIVAPNATAAFNKKITGWKTLASEFDGPMITTQLDVE